MYLAFSYVGNTLQEKLPHSAKEKILYSLFFKEYFQIVTKCPSHETVVQIIKVLSEWRIGGFPTQLSCGVICCFPVKISLNQQKVVV